MENGTGWSWRAQQRYLMKAFPHMLLNKLSGFNRITNRTPELRKNQAVQELCSLLIWISSTGKNSEEPKLTSLTDIFKKSALRKKCVKLYALPLLQILYVPKFFELYIAAKPRISRLHHAFPKKIFKMNSSNHNPRGNESRYQKVNLGKRWFNLITRRLATPSSHIGNNVRLVLEKQ